MLKPKGTNANAKVETLSRQRMEKRPKTRASQAHAPINNRGITRRVSRYEAARIGWSELSPSLIRAACSHACADSLMLAALTKAKKTTKKIRTAPSNRLNHRTVRLRLSI